MKKILALLLALVISAVSFPQPVHAEAAPSFTGLSDPMLLQHMQDSVYASLIDELDSDEYFVENVSAIYISKEYLDELAYNSQANIYFGYTLAELEQQFEGTKFVFTLGEDGQTTVQPFEAYDDTYDRVIRNVAIGTGVILLCVTVSVVTAGAGIPTAINVIFAASAKTGTAFALSGGVFSGVSAGIVTGIQTHDFDETLKSAALAGSEGFMWGAISGALIGGVSEAKAIKDVEKTIALRGIALDGLTPQQAALIQRESKYPLDVIKTLKSPDQYAILKEAGLKPVTINGKTALVRKINMSFKDEFGRTNKQRMELGMAALDPKTGLAYELHHIGQKADSTLAVLTQAEHRLGDNHKIWHLFGKASEVHGEGNTWAAQAKAAWKAMASTSI